MQVNEALDQVGSVAESADAEAIESQTKTEEEPQATNLIEEAKES